MTITEWIIFFLLVQVIHFAATWKLYQKAGRQAWEAAVPFYNAVVLMKIINRPVWWVILLFIPIVNLIMFMVVWVETIRSFGRNSRLDTILVIVTLGFYIFYVNYVLDVTYIKDRSLKPRSGVGEWVSSILFAIIAATLVHTYVMRPFTIPTSSLEKTLLVGDFLFVSKFHYGARLPMTAIAAPMVHDTIPILKTKSYVKWPQVPYFRFPGFTDIRQNDIVVFNWPVDTVNRFYGLDDGKYYDKPIDKKSNYVKRAVGLPGDSLEIIGGKIFINGDSLQLPDRAKPQYSYIVQGKGQGFDLNDLIQRYTITDPIMWYNKEQRQYQFQALSEDIIAKFKYHPNVEWIKRIEAPKGKRNIGLFPKKGTQKWNLDHYGPIYIPQKGKTVKIDTSTIPLYAHIIEYYDGKEMGTPQEITIQGDQVLMNGQPITQYTFKQDYYWMMGDNRHNSADSREYGYVPYNHVVGKPVFIWMSWDSNASKLVDKIRWERLFTTVSGSGEPVSYLYYFLIALVIYIGYSSFRKRKKKTAEE
ncbi:signal peptidase I [Gangjinia marincola]|uniref:Signal peptidase I n=1 Tax=Gangjinia marincola TaxID=578463 RepID=A0ABP3XYD2_9FLAO